MRILDLFCGAGGAAMGYHQAGFEVTGVDIKNQPRYPFQFVKADAMKLLEGHVNDTWCLWCDLDSYDAIHCSPPCQAHSDLQKQNKRDYPKLIEPLRERLQKIGKPYIIENVEGAPLRDPAVLCGVHFPGLRVIRHRLFETNFPVEPLPHFMKHPLVFTYDKRKPHYGKLDQFKDYVQVTGGGNCSVAAAKDAMGIDWMIKKELNEAIPPAYTLYIGRELAEHLTNLKEPGTIPSWK